MALSPNQIAHKCLAHQGARTCRYFKAGWNYKTGQAVSECQKLLKGKKKSIDATTQKHLDDCKKNHTDPLNMYLPIGDGGNCPGYLYLPTVIQGYDQKSKK